MGIMTEDFMLWSILHEGNSLNILPQQKAQKSSNSELPLIQNTNYRGKGEEIKEETQVKFSNYCLFFFLNEENKIKNIHVCDSNT